MSSSVTTFIETDLQSLIYYHFMIFQGKSPAVESYGSNGPQSLHPVPAVQTS